VRREKRNEPVAHRAFALVKRPIAAHIVQEFARGLNIRTGMFHPPRPGPRARVADMAVYVPDGRLTNADLAAMVETSDEWIVQRTGIRERSIAANDQFASDLCLEPCVACANASDRSTASMW